jgi:hypothetical protein
MIQVLPTVEGELLIVEIVQERRETALGHHITLGCVCVSKHGDLGTNGGRGSPGEERRRCCHEEALGGKPGAPRAPAGYHSIGGSNGRRA